MMTEQEAIDVLQNTSFFGRTMDDIDTAIDMAIKALKKQEPEAVYLTGDGEWNGHIVIDTARCQSCGFEVEECDSDWEANYCPECGQRWKWELEELEELKEFEESEAEQ